jgi:mono/diheme cytochrome c family protein
MPRVATTVRKDHQNKRPASRATALLLLGTVALALLSACAVSESRFNNATPPANIEAGRQLANAQCGNCHIVDADASVQRKDRIPGFPWIAHREDLKVETLMLFLKSNHDRMPNLALTEEQLRDISEYILSLNLSSGSPRSLHRENGH